MSVANWETIYSCQILVTAIIQSLHLSCTFVLSRKSVAVNERFAHGHYISNAMIKYDH